MNFKKKLAMRKEARRERRRQAAREAKRAEREETLNAQRATLNAQGKKKRSWVKRMVGKLGGKSGEVDLWLLAGLVVVLLVVGTLVMMQPLPALAQARDPGDFYPDSGTGAQTNPPYARGITIYGTVNTNDVMVFMDRTGSKGRGTNYAALITGLVTNTVTPTLAAYSNHVREVYLRGVEAEAGVWQIYVGD